VLRHARERHGISERRYMLTQREDEDRLTRAVIELASQYGRYGYRRITALLKRASWQVNKDRVVILPRKSGHTC
jgi:putative transposase